MRAVLVIAVLAVLAFVGYRFLYGDGSPTAGDTAQQAGQSADQAMQSAGQAVRQAGQAIQQGAQQAIDQARPAAEQAGQAAQDAGQQAQQAVQGAGQQAQQTAQNAGQQAQQTAQNAGQEAQQGLDLGRELNEATAQVRGAIEQARNSETADAARQQLEAAQARLRDLGGEVQQLPEGARATFTSAVEASLPTIRSLGEQAKGIQGVGPSLAPAIDSIIGTLEGWAGPRPPA